MSSLSVAARPSGVVLGAARMRDGFTDYQAKYYAYELQRSYASDHVGKLAGLLFDAQVEPKPHQIDAALFALQTPFLKGVILADEVGLGKTIEAGIVITQYWAERKRNILIVAPSSLRQQWQQELHEKFVDPSRHCWMRRARTDSSAPGVSAEVLICSYEFALRHELSLLRAWDLVDCRRGPPTAQLLERQDQGRRRSLPHRRGRQQDGPADRHAAAEQARGALRPGLGLRPRLLLLARRLPRALHQEP